MNTDAPRTSSRIRWTQGDLLREGLFAVAVVAAAVTLGLMGGPWVSVTNVGLLLLVAVVAAAVRARPRSALATAVLAFLAFNFFFTEPRFAWSIHRREDVGTLVAFLLAAVLSSQLAARLRTQYDQLRAVHERARTVEELTRRLAAAGDVADVLLVGADAINAAVAWPVRILHKQDIPGWSSVLGAGDAADLGPAEWSAVETCHADHRATGYGTRGGGELTWRFLPIHDVVFALQVGAPAKRPSAALELADAMVVDIARAAERARLSRELESARVTAETERLRAALLTSVSHDLRSPLASMIGSATSLAAYEAQLGPGDRRALINAIVSEGERLDRYIQNLLDMTRVGHGIELKRDWIGADELVGAAVARLRKRHESVHVRVHADPNLPALYVHSAMVEQALFNVMDNAAKHSPPDAAVSVSVMSTCDAVHFDIVDLGPGIPASERQRIFDMFHRFEHGDRRTEGVGLGLTICRGMMEAHGGSVEVLPGPTAGGTCMRLILPRVAEPPAQVLEG